MLVRSVPQAEPPFCSRSTWHCETTFIPDNSDVSYAVTGHQARETICSRINQGSMNNRQFVRRSAIGFISYFKCDFFKSISSQ